MAKNKGCPHPVKLLAWLDGEVEDIHWPGTWKSALSAVK